MTNSISNNKLVLNNEVEKAALKLLHIICEGNASEKIRVDICAKSGFIVLNEKGEIATEVSKSIYDYLESKYQYSIRLYNNTFHKNFQNVKNMSDEDYYRDQIMHYFSTYGLEAHGFAAMPYIPCEKLAIDDLQKDKLVTYQILSKPSFDKKIREFLSNIKAPRFDQMQYIKELIKYSDISCDNLVSYELKALYYDENNVMPEKPIDFLRFVIYKTTGETLIIKNDDLIKSIKNYSHKSKYYTRNELPIYKYFEAMDFRDLASIFYRFKPIFLAFKSYYYMPRIINKIRKLAIKYHKPLSDVCVQNVISIGKKKERKQDLDYLLNNMSSQDIVKCINCLNNNSDILAYTIRNSKTFVVNNKKNIIEDETDLLSEFFAELKRRHYHKFAGKTFLLPSHIEYAVPTSEKQMLYNIPYGSYLKLGSDPMTLGVAWKNVEKNGEIARVDIDLHMFSQNKHYGWNGDRQNADIIYTGDMTDAKKGAAEAYWINNTSNDYMATTCLYCGESDCVDFEFFATETKPEHFNAHYTYNPKDALFPAIPLKFDHDTALNLGLYTDGRFYFYGNSISSGMVPNGSYADFIKAIKAKLSSMLTINNLITKLGGKVIYKENGDKKVTNLLPENLATDTLIQLFRDE